VGERRDILDLRACPHTVSAAPRSTPALLTSVPSLAVPLVGVGERSSEERDERSRNVAAQPPAEHRRARTASAARRWLTTVALCCAFAAPVIAGPKHVLVLFSYDGVQPAADILGEKIRATLDTLPDGVEFYSEALDNGRFPGLEKDVAMRELMRAKYGTVGIDLVVVVGPDALAFLIRYGPELFPSAQGVFVGVHEASLPDSPLPPNVTGVVSHFDPRETLELALALQPDADRVVVISGAADADRSWDALARERLLAYRDRLDIAYVSGAPMQQLLDEVSRLPRTAIVIYLSIVLDGAGERFTAPEVATTIAAASTAPVYGVYEVYLGRGIVGGYTDTIEGMGAAAGGLALRVLTGESFGGRPSDTSESARFVVDWRQLRRWRFDESNLPPDTLVQFREPSAWDQYRRQIIAVLAVVALQAVFVVALLLLRAREKRAERELKQSEDRYRNVVEAQIDLIARYLPDTTLTFVNDAYCRCFGRTRPQLVGTKFIELIPEPDRPRVLARIRLIVAQPRGDAFSQEAVTATGTSVWLEWIDHAVTDARGAVVEIQSIGRDITHQRLAELEAQQRREQVTHLTRVAIVGQLSGALAHELNQPLSAIQSNAEAGRRFLARESFDLNEIRAILKDIVADSTRAGEVIARLRSLLKKGGRRELETFDVAAVAREVLALAHSQFVECKVAVDTRFAADLPAVRADRVQLQQVLLNLLLNACEATSGNDPGDRFVTVATASAGAGSLVVSVTDNGTGIAAETMARLFEPFFTTKAMGLGLGLSICRAIVAGHNGTLSASNNPGRGATFSLTLPAADSSLVDPR